MGDLLIRNLDDALKRELQDRAKQNGRSLSEEAVALLRGSLGGSSAADQQPAGTWLKGLLGEAWFSEDEIAAVDAARREPNREPPNFGE
jgi:antitoxin FitA